MHELTKPVRKTEVKDDLPSLDSNDEEDNDWSSNIEGGSSDIALDDDDGSFSEDVSEPADDSDVEMPYEVKPRKQHNWEANEATKVKGLPIKLANGKIQQTESKLVTAQPQSGSPTEFEDLGSSDEEQVPQQKIEDVSTGARFGRPAVVDILKTDSRKAKVEMAKNQIASICQEILADPENSVRVFPFNIMIDFAQVMLVSLVFSGGYTHFLCRPSRPQHILNLSLMTRSSGSYQFYLS